MYRINIQHAAEKSSSPSAAKLRKWAAFALKHERPAGEMTIRLVDAETIASLNQLYRHKNRPTNILSFPFDPEMAPPKAKIPYIGDIAICAEVVNGEAITQHKEIEAHWTHIVVHGVLHLLGYDHEAKREAVVMEALEKKILAALGVPDPYGEED
jgi:probable rRNA maturation factor